MNDTERLDWLDAHPYAALSRTLSKRWQVTADCFDDSGYENASTLRAAIDKAAENERSFRERMNLQPN